MIGDDAQRRATARNGIGLSKQAADNVEFTVNDIISRLEYATQQMAVARVTAGNRVWRDECWTPLQRKAWRAAKKALRKEMKRWKRRK